MNLPFLRSRLLSLIVLPGLVFPGRAAEKPLAIAAASDLVFCLEELNARFLREHPDGEVTVAVGSSGNFFSQIRNGAPFDVFLSADMAFPRMLVEEKLADEESLTPYATGGIVLWTTKPSVDVRKGLAVIEGNEVARVAIANPDHAPYGRAAREALERQGLWIAAKSKLVLGENIAQAAQFVQTGNADAGIVARSLVMAPTLAKVGTWQEISRELHRPLEQGAVITRRGTRHPLARAYVEFLRSDEAREILDRYGFTCPGSARRPGP